SNPGRSTHAFRDHAPRCSQPSIRQALVLTQADRIRARQWVHRASFRDARFVQFFDEDGSTKYYATYSAFDGKVVLPQLLETEDFLRFKISTLNGPEVRNKGFALFPRKIDGHYAMLSRQDNENIFLMYSDMLHFWYSKELILKPTYPWEYVQLGNCGSPIETEAGWLVLSHGV